jgi:hypothetical protein
MTKTHPMRDEGDDAVAEVKGPAMPVIHGHAPAAERLAVETWATRKGMLPQFSAGGRLEVRAAPGQRLAAVNLGQTSEVAPRPNPLFIEFAAAKAMHAWPEGAEVTEAEFDAAVQAAMGHTSR